MPENDKGFSVRENESESEIKFHFYCPQTKLRKGNGFTPVCQSFCSQGGSAPVHAGIHHPTGQTPPWADTPRADNPPNRRLLLWTVRILLECILVKSSTLKSHIESIKNNFITVSMWHSHDFLWNKWP